MKYIKNAPLNCQIYIGQHRKLELKNEIEMEYNIKIPLSDFFRQALDAGIPAISKDRSFTINLIG